MNPRDLFTTRNVAIGLAALLILAFAGPALGLSTFFYRDFGVLGYPTAAYHREMFWRGELPLWNPYSNCGVPFLAQWGTMVLYPFTLIYLLLPFPWSLNFFCLAHLWWGGLGVFRLAKNWTDSSEAAALAAVLFVFNGITLSTLSWPNYTAAFAWMPWIVLFASNPTPLLLTAAGTMQMLVGAPEITILTWLIVFGTWFFNQGASKSLAPILAAIILIAALSAIQLLPFFQLLSLSQRQTGLIANKWSMPIGGIANFLLPMLHAFKTPQGTLFQHEQHFLSSTYLGLPAILLATIGALRGQRLAKFLAAASIVCILLALGTNLPGYSLIQKIPILGLARYPVKFTLILPLAISLAAAFGFAKLDLKNFSRAAALLALVSIAALAWILAHPYVYDRKIETINNSLIRFAFFAAFSAAVWLWKKSARTVYALALIPIIFFDGRFHLPNQNPTTETKTLRAALGSHPFPKLGEGRIFISKEAEDALLKSNVPDLGQDFIGKQLAQWSHLNLIELVPKVNGSATLQIKEQKEIQDWLYSGSNVNQQAWLDFLGVTTITKPGAVVEWTNRPTAWPMIRAVESSNGNETLAAVTMPEFDPRKPLPREYEKWPAKISAVSFNPHQISFHVESELPVSILIPQTYYRAWRGKVNGRSYSQPVLHRGNYAFMMVSVPKGGGDIALAYEDREFRRGACISLLTLTGCCLFGVIRWRRAR